MPRTKGAVMVNRQEMPEGRGAIWRSIRMLRQFTFDDLLDATGQSYPHCRRYVRRLLLAGYLRLVEQSRGGREINVYRLVRDTGAEPPIPRAEQREVFDPNNGQTYSEAEGETARDRAWAFMRCRHPFTMQSLVTLGLQKHNAYKYVAGLLEAGYLAQTVAAKSGPNGHAAEYVLIRDTGEEPPIVRRSGVVVDPNLVADEDSGS